VKRRILAPFLICALLALPGCGVVKGVAKRGVVRFLGGAVAGMLFGTQKAAAEDESAPADDPSVAKDDGGIFGSEEEEPAEASGASGFYKVVEANGTVRFVTNLAEVPASQRPNAERLAMERSGDPARPKQRIAAKHATQQLAAAKTSAPRATATSGSHEVVIYTTSWCGWCKRTRAWLDQKGVDYENRDVEANAAWAKESQDLTGSDGVPVVVIDGEVIKGFDVAKMESLLGG
jgi:glutaredoxin-like YruB-family protein